MLPRVIWPNQVSLDGHIDRFQADLGRHYELVAHWQADIHLVGSDTILSMAATIPPGR